MQASSILTWFNRGGIGLIVGLLLLILWTQGPSLLLTNLGNIAYLQVVDSDKLGTYTAPVRNEATLSNALSYTQQAVRLNPRSMAGRWSLGRVAVAAGEYQLAREALEPLTPIAKDNLYLYTDLLTATSQEGQAEAAIALYDSFGNPASQSIVTDTVTASYLLLAATRLETGDSEAAAPLLEQALVLQPGNLYATYHLWQQAEQRGNREEASRLRFALQHFPVEPFIPADSRILAYATEVIPNLIAEEVWDDTRTSNVLALLAFRGAAVTEVQQLLNLLVNQHPDQALWRFRLAEWYERAGQLEKAEEEYQSVLQTDPTFSQAYLRLGLLCEAQSSSTAAPCPASEASSWYGRYYDAAPDDLMGLKRLLEIGATDPALQTKWQAVMDDTVVVASMLNIPQEAIILGPNVADGSFEEWDRATPLEWQWSNMADGQRFDPGAFAGGMEETTPQGERGVRIDGLWLEDDPNLNPGRWGLRFNTEKRFLSLEANSVYMFSFLYRTEDALDETAAFFISDAPGLTFATLDYRLPSTNGAWKRFVAIGANTNETPILVAPYLRSFSIGRVWFDDFQMRQLYSETIIPASVTPALSKVLP